MTRPRWSLVLLLALLPTTLPALPGCPKNSTTYCYPGEDVGGCEGTEWEDDVNAGALPDGDGTCPVGTHLFCTGDTDCSGLDSTDVMEAACSHAYDHDWSDCSVLFLCGPVEASSDCCFLIDVDGPTEG